MPDPLSIIYEDEYFVAINKPPGLMVHRTRISEDEVFVLQILRDQIGQKVYPVHRLDRGTSGALLFGKSSEAASKYSVLIRANEIQKKYLAIVRGYVEDLATIDYALKLHDSDERQHAVTKYQKLAQVELPWAINKYPQSRYSLIEAELETGRWHQIRRHFSHLRHPVIGDKKHGDNKHNNFFREKKGLGRMMLHASSLEFVHPFTEQTVFIKADLEEEMRIAIELLGFNVEL